MPWHRAISAELLQRSQGGLAGFFDKVRPGIAAVRCAGDAAPVPSGRCGRRCCRKGDLAMQIPPRVEITLAVRLLFGGKAPSIAA